MVGFFMSTAVLGVADAGAKQIFHALGESLAGGLPLGRGEPTFRPVALLLAFMEKMLHQLGRIPGSWFFQRAGG